MNAEPNAALTYTMYAPPSDDVTSVKLIDARNGVFSDFFNSVLAMTSGRFYTNC